MWRDKSKQMAFLRKPLDLSVLRCLVVFSFSWRRGEMYLSCPRVGMHIPPALGGLSGPGAHGALARAGTPGSSACGRQVVSAETRAVGFPCMYAHNSCLRQTHCFSNCFCNWVLNVKRSWVTYFFIQNVQNWCVCFVIAKCWVEKKVSWVLWLFLLWV